MNCAHRWIKIQGIIVTLILILVSQIRFSEAKLLVIGTTEHEALLARAVGGDIIEVRWIVGADLDPQIAELDEGFIPILEQADILLVNGQGIEAGWLGPLLKGVKNKKIMPGQEGYVSLSEGVNLLPYTGGELQESRFQEIMEAKGMRQIVANHHYWLDPANEIPMINNIKNGLSKIDPTNAKVYQSNAQELIVRLEAKIKEWDAGMAPFKGKKIIVYHRDWTYFAHRHGLEVVSYIEPKELTRPKEEDFRNLATRYKNQEVSIVLLSENERPPFVDIDSITQLAVKIHAHRVIIPDSMSPAEKRGDIISYFDYVYFVLTSILK